LLSNSSYIGWLCAVAWQTAVAGVGYFIGTLIQALFILNIPNYVPQKWHATLIALGYLVIAVIFNTVLARKLPLLEGIFVICHILGIVIFIPLLILSPRTHGAAPLIDFYNPGGWSSNGLATLVGTAAPIASLTGFDCSIHMGMSILLFWVTFSDTF
jgi:choline transport protein